MIRTVAVYTGESSHARVAQHHAIEIAKLFSARLRVLGLWTCPGEPSAERGGEAAQEALKRSRREVLRAAAKAGLEVIEGTCASGVSRGVDQEARETDLLVLAIPNRAGAGGCRLALTPAGTTLEVMRKADCDILVVSEPPRPLRRILVVYEGGNAGKAVLRLAGAVAEKSQARVSVLTMQNALSDANQLAGAAVEYLRAFNLPSVESLPRIEPNASKEVIFDVSAALGADMIAVTEKVRNAFERFLSANLAERMALASTVPLLVAR